MLTAPVQAGGRDEAVEEGRVGDRTGECARAHCRRVRRRRRRPIDSDAIREDERFEVGCHEGDPIEDTGSSNPRGETDTATAR